MIFRFGATFSLEIKIDLTDKRPMPSCDGDSIKLVDNVTTPRTKLRALNALGSGGALKGSGTHFCVTEEESLSDTPARLHAMTPNLLQAETFALCSGKRILKMV